MKAHWSLGSIFGVGISVLAFFIFLCILPSMGAEKINLTKLTADSEKAGWKAKDYGKKFHTGLKGHSPSMSKKAISTKKAVKALPPSLDYRDQGLVSPVKDQGNCGSCWAFASVGTLESALMFSAHTPNQALDLSEQIVVSCDSANQGCNGGYMDAVANFMRDHGTGLESCYPYTATDGSCSKACAESGKYKIVNWGYATSVLPDLNAIKSALVTYGPLVTTMMVYSDFMYYESGVYHYTSGSLEGGHAIVLVGYDDAGQYFIVKNSWGEGWGESGYFRIGYSELTSRTFFGEETIYFEIAPPNPPPPPGCNFSISPASAEFPNTGGTGTVLVTVEQNCSWTATTTSPWITVGMSGGIGSGTVSYTVAENTSTNQRTGVVTIDGLTFTISQASAAGGCDTAMPKTSGANKIQPWYKFW